MIGHRSRPPSAFRAHSGRALPCPEHHVLGGSRHVQASFALGARSHDFLTAPVGWDLAKATSSCVGGQHSGTTCGAVSKCEVWQADCGRRALCSVWLLFQTSGAEAADAPCATHVGLPFKNARPPRLALAPQQMSFHASACRDMCLALVQSSVVSVVCLASSRPSALQKLRALSRWLSSIPRVLPILSHKVGCASVLP